MKEIIKNRYNFLLWLMTFIIFYLNSNHIIQQGTLENYYIPLAKNLISNLCYSLNGYCSSPSFYPIWGYTFLLLPDMLFKTNFLILLILQYILTILSINLFYYIFNVEKKHYHLILFLPFIAIMSTKTPDAIISFLIIVSLYFIKRYIDSNHVKYIIFAGISSGIILNFRSEYLYLFIFPLLLVIFLKRNLTKDILKISLIVFLITIVCLLPWCLRYYSYNQHFKFTATNGGAVMFLSLGQLPNNIWKIEPYDETVYKIADSMKFDNPYTIQADNYFTNQFITKIKEHPIEYLKKITYNFLSSLIRGVYIGEYANLFIDKNIRYDWERNLNRQSGFLKKLKYIKSSDHSIIIPVIIEKIIQILFIPLFLALVILVFFKYLKNDKNLYDIFLISIIIYKFLIVSLIQYEYRHMNSIYLILLGIVLASQFDIKLLKNKINQ